MLKGDTVALASGGADRYLIVNAVKEIGHVYRHHHGYWHVDRA